MTKVDMEIARSDEGIVAAVGGVASSGTMPSAETGVALRVKQHSNERFRKVLPDDDDQPAPFLCECDDANCTRIVWLTQAAYDEAGADGRRSRVEGVDA